jgi:hypothetical protein
VLVLASPTVVVSVVSATLLLLAVLAVIVLVTSAAVLVIVVPYSMYLCSWSPPLSTGCSRCVCAGVRSGGTVALAVHPAVIVQLDMVVVVAVVVAMVVVGAVDAVGTVDVFAGVVVQPPPMNCQYRCLGLDPA